MMELKRALTIAGSDSGGGAGIQADLKTFGALGVFGMSVLTALTAQNTVGVTGVHEVPPDFVAAQIDAVMSDLGTDAVKTGMLSNAAIIEVVAERLRHYAVPALVVDPVMVAKSGDALLRADACTALVEALLPLATIVTPNLPEAGVLTGSAVTGPVEMHAAAKRIHDLGPSWVLIKGGHLPGDQIVDLLYDGRDFLEFAGDRIDTPNTHGTGCTLASAIAAGLAQGSDVPEAVRRGRDYLQHVLQVSRNLRLGHGHGPMHHFG